jgi:hypothetical protein
MTVLIGLIKSHSWILGSFSWTLWTSKHFNPPTFWLLDPTIRLCGWLKQKCIFFLGKRIITLSLAPDIKLSTAKPVESHRFSLLPSNLLLFHLLHAAPLPLLTPWLVKLTKSFMTPTSPSSMRTRALLGQRATL